MSKFVSLRMSFSQAGPILALALLICFTTAAQATMIVPGPGAFPPDVFTIAAGQLSLGASTGLTAFQLKDVFGNTVGTGTYIAGVFRDSANIYGANDLDFIYQVSVTSGDVGRATATNFNVAIPCPAAGGNPATSVVCTDVGYTLTGANIGGPWVNGTVAPQTVDRNTADIVGFTYSAPLALQIKPGQTSVVMVIETNATAFVPGALNLIDGGTANLAAFAPAPRTTTPEPASFAMMGAGLLAFAGMRRFRRQ